MNAIQEKFKGVKRGLWDKIKGNKQFIAEMPHGLDESGLMDKRIVFRLRLKGKDEDEKASQQFWEDVESRGTRTGRFSRDKQKFMKREKDLIKKKVETEDRGKEWLKHDQKEMELARKTGTEGVLFAQDRHTRDESVIFTEDLDHQRGKEWLKHDQKQMELEYKNLIDKKRKIAKAELDEMERFMPPIHVTAFSVKEYEAALLLKGGQMVDVIPSGTWEIEDAFQVTGTEIIWVDTTQFKMKWGVSEVRMADNAVIGSHGICYLQVKDPRLFVLNMVSSKKIVEQPEIEEFIREAFVTAIKSQLEEMDSRSLTGRKKKELEMTVRADLYDIFEKWGLELVRLEFLGFKLPAALQALMDKQFEVALSTDGMKVELDLQRQQIEVRIQAAELELKLLEVNDPVRAAAKLKEIETLRKQKREISLDQRLDQEEEEEDVERARRERRLREDMKIERQRVEEETLLDEDIIERKKRLLAKQIELEETDRLKKIDRDAEYARKERGIGLEAKEMELQQKKLERSLDHELRADEIDLKRREGMTDVEIEGAREQHRREMELRRLDMERDREIGLERDRISRDREVGLAGISKDRDIGVEEYRYKNTVDREDRTMSHEERMESIHSDREGSVQWGRNWDGRLPGAPVGGVGAGLARSDIYKQLAEKEDEKRRKERTRDDLRRENSLEKNSRQIDSLSDEISRIEIEIRTLEKQLREIPY